MPKVYKLTVGGLRKIIQEESQALKKEAAAFGEIRDVEKEAKKTREVDADEYADTLEKELNQLKAQKVQESKLLSDLKTLRESMRARIKKINEAKKSRS
jgi:hypothetical protein